MAALSELTCLGLHRPAPSASPSEMSAWFSRLARVHTHLAQESRGEHAAIERQRAAAFARRAQSLNHHH